MVEASAVIDLDLFLTMAATELFLGQGDGYIYGPNNFFLYRRPGDMRWVFMPWGMDLIMQDDLDPFVGFGRVSQMCNASLECRKLLAAKLEGVVARIDELDLPGVAQTIADNVRSAAVDDPRKEYSMDMVDACVSGNIDFLTRRGNVVMDQLICTDPSAVDVDKDGFSGCIDDCDDGNGAVYPGAPEVCDLDDDDCHMKLDNDPMCPQCAEQPLPAPAVGRLALCFDPKASVEAEADCVAQGGHLLSIHDLEMQNFAAMAALAFEDPEWWIGLSDLNTEGSFVWTDGTPFDYDRWVVGGPNDLDDTDCGSLERWSGDWIDVFCLQPLPYICRLP